MHAQSSRARTLPRPRGTGQRVRGSATTMSTTANTVAPNPDELVVVDRNGPAVAIFDSGGCPGTTSAEFRPTITIVRYPSGELLAQWVEPTEELRQELLNSRLANKCFDFDGNGVEDRTEWDNDGWVRVRSGVDGRELWSSHDPLEYEWVQRITPLGDLDGDGFAEIAVLHPRQDRSRYDWELFDLAFGAKSWLSIVSGSRVAHR